MRILMLNYDCPPLGAGAGRMVLGLSSELVRAGHQVDWVTMGFPRLAAAEEVHGVQVYRVPCLRRRAHLCTEAEAATYVLSATLAVRRLVGRHRYHLVHGHFIFPGGPVAWLAARWARLPYVITAHGSDVPGYNPYRLRRAHRLLAPLWRSLVRDAAKIVCPSRRLRTLLARSATVPVEVIPNGLAVSPAPAAVRPSPGRILIVGRMVELKGVHHALAALRGFSRPYELHVVGDGPQLAALRRLAEALDVRATFWGWLDRRSEALRQLFATASIFVLPSESENFPVVLLEAMAARLPIITTMNTGCDEVVGEAALLVPPGDVPALRAALGRLIDDDGLRGVLGEAARQRLEGHFSWPVVAQRYCELYAQVVDGHRR